MKHVFWITIFVFSIMAQNASAQGYGDPLTIQGIDHNTSASAASRAMGSTTIGLMNEVGVMFLNPAGLQSLKGIQFSLGATQRHTDVTQVQRYSTLKYYSNFSLLMEGLTGYIPDPDTSLPGVNAGDTVQRPFDTIGPNWSRTQSNVLPLQAMLGIPFSIGEQSFVAGVGAIEFADLSHYYQNNNVLSPSILSVRPIPIPRPPSDSLPVLARWSQHIRSRDGPLYGYGAALSGSVNEKISAGVSALFISGSTDDFEQHTERGLMTFYTSFFRLDSVYGVRTETGTSEYSGSEFTVSGIYRGKHVSLGLSVKPPMSITRTYTGNRRVDSMGVSSTVAVSGEDKIQLPWRGTVGLSLAPLQDLTLGLEYEIRSYASAVYTNATGVESNPWVSSSVFHIGASYALEPWLMLRGGVRGQAESFEPEGIPIAGEPVAYSVYSLGGGITVGGIRFNLTYEYASMKYEDVWNSAISLNRDKRHTFIADISYEFP